MNPKKYGMDDLKGVLGLVKEIAAIKDGLVLSQLSDGLDNLDIFARLTEEHRRERQRRIDAGDETAKLKFSPLAAQAAQTAKASFGAATTGAAPKQGGTTWQPNRQWQQAPHKPATF